MTLQELNSAGNLFYTDKGCIHSYLPVYEELFAPFRDEKINLFEVGYQNGGSSMLWKSYFTKAIIRSIDIYPWRPSKDEQEKRSVYKMINWYIPPRGRVSLDILDVNDLMPDYFDDFNPDIAIDDGSHQIKEQIHFVKTVYPVLKEGGLLIVEDIQNIEKDVKEFKKLKIPFKVIDLRDGVYDDVLILFEK